MRAPAAAYSQRRRKVVEINQKKQRCGVRAKVRFTRTYSKQNKCEKLPDLDKSCRFPVGQGGAPPCKESSMYKNEESVKCPLRHRVRAQIEFTQPSFS